MMFNYNMKEMKKIKVLTIQRAEKIAEERLKHFFN